MLNTEEISMLSIFNTVSRKRAIQDILDHLSSIQDVEMKTLVFRILKKLEKMSDDEFCVYDFALMEDPEDE